MSEDLVGTLVLGATAVAVGPFVHWLARRAATGRLHRNHLAGLRTSRTLASDEAWVLGHRAALGWTRRTARATVVLGLVTTALGLSGALTAALATGLAAMAVVVAGSLLGTAAAHRALG